MKKISLSRYAIYLVLLFVLAFFSIATDNFLSSKNFLVVARQVSMVMIASVGMTCVMIAGGIDLSVGSMISFMNIGAAYLINEMGWNPYLACFVFFLLLVAIGAFQGFLIAKINIPPMIMTMAFMKILSGLAWIISNVPISRFPQSFLVVGQGMIAGVVPVPVVIMIVLVAIGWFILNKTFFGRHFYAIGGNEEAARLSGVNVTLTKVIAYAFSAAFSGLAGIVMLARVNSGVATNGDGFEFELITACALGGVSVSGGAGRVSGMVAGALIIGFLKNGLVLMNISDYVQTVVQGIVLLLAVAFDCIQKNKKIVKKEKAA